MREDFEAAHPEFVKQVIEAYARARRRAMANPDALAGMLAASSGLSLDTARFQLGRVDFAGAAVGPERLQAILAAAPILKASGKISAGADIDKAGATKLSTRLTTELGLPDSGGLPGLIDAYLVPGMSRPRSRTSEAMVRWWVTSAA